MTAVRFQKGPFATSSLSLWKDVDLVLLALTFDGKDGEDGSECRNVYSRDLLIELFRQEIDLVPVGRGFLPIPEQIKPHQHQGTSLRHQEVEATQIRLQFDIKNWGAMASCATQIVQSTIGRHNRTVGRRNNLLKHDVDDFLPSKPSELTRSISLSKSPTKALLITCFTRSKVLMLELPVEGTKRAVSDADVSMTATWSHPCTPAGRNWVPVAREHTSIREQERRQ